MAGKKFIWTTMQQRINSYVAPSGRSYMFQRGVPTVVDLPVDIEHFKANKRFKEATILDKFKGSLKPKDSEQDKTPEEVMVDYLMSFDGIGKKLSEQLVERFSNLQNLALEVVSGIDFTADGFTEKQHALIYGAIAQWDGLAPDDRDLLQKQLSEDKE